MMKLNCKLISTGLALLLAAIAYACMRLADSISGTSFLLLWVIIPGLLLALFGIWASGKEAEPQLSINGSNGSCNICNKENRQK